MNFHPQPALETSQLSKRGTLHGLVGSMWFFQTGIAVYGENWGSSGFNHLKSRTTATHPCTRHLVMHEKKMADRLLGALKWPGFICLPQCRSGKSKTRCPAPAISQKCGHVRRTFPIWMPQLGIPFDGLPNCPLAHHRNLQAAQDYEMKCGQVIVWLGASVRW